MKLKSSILIMCVVLLVFIFCTSCKSSGSVSPEVKKALDGQYFNAESLQSLVPKGCDVKTVRNSALISKILLNSKCEAQNGIVACFGALNVEPMNYVYSYLRYALIISNARKGSSNIPLEEIKPIVQSLMTRLGDLPKSGSQITMKFDMSGNPMTPSGLNEEAISYIFGGYYLQQSNIEKCVLDVVNGTNNKQ